MWRVLVMLVALLTPALQAHGDELGRGVSAALAAERAARISGVRYALRLAVPERARDPVEGWLDIRFTLEDASRRLPVDFAAEAAHVHRITVAGRPLEITMVNGHIVVPSHALVTGVNVITISFTAGDAPLNRQEDFLYSVFVPARAHETFPCFDQPDLKARFTLTLEIPEGWHALSNAGAIERSVQGTRARLRFAETAPLPTYLFAVAAGRFSIETAERLGRTYRMFHRETDAARLARNRDALFDLHASALDWMERYTGIPYPWGKLDFFLVPAFQFGGMEHPGAIYYNAPALLLEPSATTNQLLDRASVIAHETAHMWFGDLVTMRWFDDVWMKEVFANHFAAKIVNPSFPAINHDLRFLYAHYPGAYAVDRSAGTHPIRQPLDNLRDAGTLYGPIIYLKAAIVMRQLERLLGEEPMRDGLREYLRAFSFGNASWLDLIALLDRRTPQDLAAWSHVWVEEAGRPTITAHQRFDTNGGLSAVAVEQRDEENGSRIWPQQIELAIGYPDEIRTARTVLGTPRVEDHAVEGWPRPVFVLPNGGGIAYGRIVLDDDTRRYLLNHLPDVPDALTRGSAWITLWDELLERHVSPAALFDLALRAVRIESDELNVQRMLDTLDSVFWRFSTEAARGARAAEIERVLQEGLDRAATQSLKGAWFRALMHMALTPGAIAWLTRVWRLEVQVPGLILSEPDYTALAQELAVRGVPDAEGILDAQLDRIQNPDRRARFAYVRPALSADRRVRDDFFVSLENELNRRHEPWVLEALGFLHHPLRAAEAERYVRPSLEMLGEIQRTGDIFFPKRWADATLEGHNSVRVAATVRTFLDEHPDLSPRLRRIVLQSADELFRASTILGM